MMTFSITPGLIFILGSFFTFLVKKNLQKLVILSIPFLAAYNLFYTSSPSTIPFLTGSLDLMHTDTLSVLFGSLFIFVSIIAFIYGFNTAKHSEYIAALIYIGSAISVVFTKDYISLYIFWELMALSSVFLILLKGTNFSRKAGLRYIVVHLVGGLILLAGIILQIHQTDSILIAPLELTSVSTILIFIGVLVNAAAVPFSSWLTDAYPESTLMGGVILSSITTKTALYVLLRVFAGVDILIFIGAFMAVYGVFFGLIENNIRRCLAFSVINQLGFKLLAVGLGSPLAIAGACLHAVCGVIYNSVLWMTAGSIIERTGKENFSDLSALRSKMPVIFTYALIGVASISALPLTSGFVSKKLIVKAVEKANLVGPWIMLEIASFGVILFIACKFIYFAFIRTNPNVVISVKKINPFMSISTSVMAFLCIYLGLFPKSLYNVVPYSAELLASTPSYFSAIYIKYFSNSLISVQKFLFTVSIFLIFINFKFINNKITLDFDWFYRRLLRYVTLFLISFIDFIYNFINKVTMSVIRVIVQSLHTLIAYILFN